MQRESHGKDATTAGGEKEDRFVAGGTLALVDFHATRFQWFARWMACNHVRMEGHLLPLLRANFEPRIDRLRPGYGGIWQYLVFVGTRKS